MPVILGGIEASLRRLTHYDYWQDKVRPSILVESGADLLIYGMGEKPVTNLCRRMKEKPVVPTDLPQTAYVVRESEFQAAEEDLRLFSHEECLKDKKKQAQNFRHIEEESNKYAAARIFQQTGKQVVVVNPPYPPMTQASWICRSTFLTPVFPTPNTRENVFLHTT